MVDLAVSLASGSPFLGAFDIPEAVPVLLLSGESGGFVIKDTVARVCRAKNIERGVAGLEGRFFVGFELPQLSQADQVEENADRRWNVLPQEPALSYDIAQNRLVVTAAMAAYIFG